MCEYLNILKLHDHTLSMTSNQLLVNKKCQVPVAFKLKSNVNSISVSSLSFLNA
jgi:hypothetical protein